MLAESLGSGIRGSRRTRPSLSQVPSPQRRGALAERKAQDRVPLAEQREARHREENLVGEKHRAAFVALVLTLSLGSGGRVCAAYCDLVPQAHTNAVAYADDEPAACHGGPERHTSASEQRSCDDACSSCQSSTTALVAKSPTASTPLSLAPPPELLLPEPVLSVELPVARLVPRTGARQILLSKSSLLL